jgi:hypothetical protein
MSFWEMTMEEHKKNQLFHKFNKEYYEGIEAFQGKYIITTPIHVQDL